MMMHDIAVYVTTFLLYLSISTKGCQFIRPISEIQVSLEGENRPIQRDEDTRAGTAANLTAITEKPKGEWPVTGDASTQNKGRTEFPVLKKNYKKESLKAITTLQTNTTWKLHKEKLTTTRKRMKRHSKQTNQGKHGSVSLQLPKSFGEMKNNIIPAGSDSLK